MGKKICPLHWFAKGRCQTVAKRGVDGGARKVGNTTPCFALQSVDVLHVPPHGTFYDVVLPSFVPTAMTHLGWNPSHTLCKEST